MSLQEQINQLEVAVEYHHNQSVYHQTESGKRKDELVQLKAQAVAEAAKIHDGLIYEEGKIQYKVIDGVLYRAEWVLSANLMANFMERISTGSVTLANAHNPEKKPVDGEYIVPGLDGYWMRKNGFWYLWCGINPTWHDERDRDEEFSKFVPADFSGWFEGKEHFANPHALIHGIIYGKIYGTNQREECRQITVDQFKADVRSGKLTLVKADDEKGIA